MTNDIINMSNQLQPNNGFGAMEYQPTVANATCGYTQNNGVAPVDLIEKPVNKFVYGKKYRTILAAEGWAVVDSYQQECLIRSNYLPTVVDLRVFHSVDEAVWYIVRTAAAYAAWMLGPGFGDCFNWPAVVKVNTINPFPTQMVEKIAAKRIDYFDKTGLPRLAATNAGEV